MSRELKSITLCSSLMFYKKCLELEKELKKMGFRVFIEYTARVMQKSGDYRSSTYKPWFKNPGDYLEKAKLIRKHFRAIEKGDAVLIVNLKKKGIEGYKGGNVLMEMGLAFYLKKPIFLWKQPSPKSPLYEEIMGMLPNVINEDLSVLSSSGLTRGSRSGFPLSRE